MNKECFKKFPEFETERLSIRAFTESDFHDYVSWYCEDILYYMRGIHYIKNDDIDTFRRLFLKNVPRMFKNKESIIWCISKKKSNQNIGKIEMCQFDKNSNTAQIHYCLSKNERSKGYMEEAVKEILKWAFGILDLNRIYTYVWEENKASLNVLIKCGFQFEGLLRENSVSKFTFDGHEIKEKGLIYPIEYKNEFVYGLLRSEYYGT